MWDSVIIKPFINFLLWIYATVGNLGVAIILFTAATRLVLYPLTAKQIKSSQAMQELQKNKRYIEIQEKYKNDKEKLAQEQMKLYQELKISPFASCLPTLLQFPLIIGLYQALIQTVASAPIDLLNLVRHIYPSFLKVADLIPLNTNFLWMDLGHPERLYIPGLSFGIPVLAIVVVITTYISTKIITPPPQAGGSANDQTAMMSNMMNIYMPLLMGWMAWTLASGLALYFVVTNLIQILQYAVTGKVYWGNILPGRGATPDTKKPVKK
ncbi:Membrane protein insertase YidC 2 [bioreactor metagenome]|uniref:Membrane protein insertase YidC 2 n=1 Tax=bioreactor metagenome TaxID=1076179 RepID=A0A644ZC18_9ZZZZ